MVSSSFSSLAVTSSSLYCDVVKVEFKLQSASDVALLFIVLDMVELLADFSIPPDANDVFEDEMEIGNCCGRNDWIFYQICTISEYTQSNAIIIQKDIIQSFAIYIFLVHIRLIN